MPLKRKDPGVPWTLGLQSILLRHTNVDQLDSGIAVHGTDTNKQEYQMIQAYQSFNKPVVHLPIIVHMPLVAMHHITDLASARES